MDIVECRQVRRSFAGAVALAGATCSFPAGSISALVGPSGAGKTTLMRVIVGTLTPDSGEVLFDGATVAAMSEVELRDMRHRIGVIQEGPGALFSSMTVLENVAFPLRHSGRFHEDEVLALATERLAEVGLGHDGDKTPDQVSTGMRVRAALARALALEPDTLICDSLEYGMDPAWSRQLYDLIRDRHGGHLKNVILITHDIDGVRSVSDHVVVLHQGRVVEQGSPAEIRASASAFTAAFLDGSTDGAHMDAFRGEEMDLEARRRLLEGERRAWMIRAVVVLLVSAALVAALYVVNPPDWRVGR